MDNTNFFGLFLREKRLQKELSLRKLAELSGLSHIYLHHVENGDKAPPSDVSLMELANALKLDNESRNIFFDLAAKSKSEHDKSNFYSPVDVARYINEQSNVKNVIREADKQNKSNEFWDELLKDMMK